MDQRRIERLLRHVIETEVEEISCSECFDLLAAGVELEVSGAPSAPASVRLAHHLRQCGVCREEYETLRDFVRSEGEDPAPPPEGTSPASS